MNFYGFLLVCIQTPIGSSGSKIRRGSSHDLTFHSSESTRSGTSDQDKIKRKIPIIQKSKLNVPSVFGNTSTFFGTQYKPNESTKKTQNFRAADVRAPPKSSIDLRATDTNYMETMKRLEVI